MFADAAEGGFEANHPAEAGRDADGATAVGADGDGAESGGDGSGRTAGAAAGVMGEVIGVAGDAVVAVEAVGVEAEFVHVGLADEQGAGGAEAADNGGVGYAGVVTEEGGADGGGVGELVYFVLDSHRHAIEQAEGLALAVAFGRGFCLGKQVGAVGGAEGVERPRAAVAFGDGGEDALGDFGGGGSAVAVSAGVVGDGVEEGLRLGEGGLFECMGVKRPLVAFASRFFFPPDGVEGGEFGEGLFAQGGDAAVVEQAGEEGGAGDGVFEGGGEEA